MKLSERIFGIYGTETQQPNSDEIDSWGKAARNLEELLQKVVDRGQLPIGMDLRDRIRVAIDDRSPGSPLAPLHPEKD
jgi:hypothetical protein